MGGNILNIGGGGKKGIFPERLEITSMPKITQYCVGDIFDKDGLSIELYYGNGAHTPIENFIITPSGPLKDTDDHITVSYTEAGKTVSISIEIQVSYVYEKLEINSWKKN